MNMLESKLRKLISELRDVSGRTASTPAIKAVYNTSRNIADELERLLAEMPPTSVRDTIAHQYNDACACKFCFANRSLVRDLEKRIGEKMAAERDVVRSSAPQAEGEAIDNRVVDTPPLATAPEQPTPEPPKCSKCGNAVAKEEGYESGGPQGWIVTQVGGCPACLKTQLAELAAQQPTPEQTDLERATKFLTIMGCGYSLYDMRLLAAEFQRVREEMKEQCAKARSKLSEAIVKAEQDLEHSVGRYEITCVRRELLAALEWTKEESL
jgi:hypothetical protein